jgi:hypothetical protein
VTADEEAIAKAARPLKKVKFYVKNQRDCGAASTVGAATVAISLLIGDGKVTLDAFYVLLVVQTLLIYAAAFFVLRSVQLMAPDWSKAGLAGLAFAMGLVSTIITLVGSYLTSQLKQHGSNVGSSSWWLLLGLAGIGALLGLIIRRSAESLLDKLADESWKQRVAPLVNEQKQAVAEMGELAALLKNAPGEATEARVASASHGTLPSAS